MSEHEQAGGPVHHPAHYNAHPSGVECIDVIEWMPHNIGAAVKYLWRADEKGQHVRDLHKAIWYINREIARLTGPGPVAPRTSARPTPESPAVDGASRPGPASAARARARRPRASRSTGPARRRRAGAG